MYVYCAWTYYSSETTSVLNIISSISIHWGRDYLTQYFTVDIVNIFSWIKTILILTDTSPGFALWCPLNINPTWLTTSRRQAIIWTSDGLVKRCLYTVPNDGLINRCIYALPNDGLINRFIYDLSAFEQLKPNPVGMPSIWKRHFIMCTCHKGY